MTLSPLPFLKPHFHNNAGGPATGYKLYAYDSSTNDALPLYSEPSGTAYPNPLILNSRGEPDGTGIYLDDDYTYKLVLTSNIGTPIWTVNNVRGTSGGGSSAPIILPGQTLYGNVTEASAEATAVTIAGDLDGATTTDIPNVGAIVDALTHYVGNSGDQTLNGSLDVSGSVNATELNINGSSIDDLFVKQMGHSTRSVVGNKDYSGDVVEDITIADTIASGSPEEIPSVAAVKSYVDSAIDAVENEITNIGPVNNVSVSSTDATSDFLINKLQAGTNITLTKVNSGASEKVEISSIGESPISAGVSSFPGPEWTSPSLGVITMESCTVRLYDNDNFIGSLTEYEVPSATFTLSQNVDQIVIARYVAGAAEYALVTNTFDAWNDSSSVPVYRVWYDMYDGVSIHSQSIDSLGLGLANKVARRIGDTAYYARSRNTGLILTGSNRNVYVSAAKVWAGAVINDVASYDSYTDSLNRYIKTAGVWTSTTVSNVDASYINDNSGLVAMGNNKYAVRYIFRSISDSKHGFYVSSKTEYNTVDAARDDVLRADLPVILTGQCMLVGRVILQKDASSFAVVESAFTQTFTGGSGGDSYKTLVDSSDATPGYLADKIIAGTGVTITNNSHNNLSVSLTNDPVIKNPSTTQTIVGQPLMLTQSTSLVHAYNSVSATGVSMWADDPASTGHSTAFLSVTQSNANVGVSSTSTDGTSTVSWQRSSAFGNGLYDVTWVPATFSNPIEHRYVLVGSTNTTVSKLQPSLDMEWTAHNRFLGKTTNSTNDPAAYVQKYFSVADALTRDAATINRFDLDVDTESHYELRRGTTSELYNSVDATVTTTTATTGANYKGTIGAFRTAILNANSTNSALVLSDTTNNAQTNLTRTASTNSTTLNHNGVVAMTLQSTGVPLLHKDTVVARPVGTSSVKVQTLEGQSYISRLAPNASREWVRLFTWTNTAGSVAWYPSFSFRVQGLKSTADIDLVIQADASGNLSYTEVYGTAKAKYSIITPAIASLALQFSANAFAVWYQENSSDDYVEFKSIVAPQQGTLDTTSANQTALPTSGTLVRCTSVDDGKSYLAYYPANSLRDYSRLFVFNSNGTINRNLESVSFAFDSIENRCSGVVCFSTDASGNIVLSSTNPCSVGSYGTSGVYATLRLVVSGNTLSVWYYDTGINDRVILRSIREPSDFGYIQLTNLTQTTDPGGTTVVSTNDPYMRH